MSTDKDTESPDGSVSCLSDRTNRQRTAFSVPTTDRIETEQSGRLDPDRQTKRDKVRRQTVPSADVCNNHLYQTLNFFGPGPTRSWISQNFPVLVRVGLGFPKICGTGPVLNSPFFWSWSGLVLGLDWTAWSWISRFWSVDPCSESACWWYQQFLYSVSWAIFSMKGNWCKRSFLTSARTIVLYHWDLIYSYPGRWYHMTTSILFYFYFYTFRQ